MAKTTNNMMNSNNMEKLNKLKALAARKDTKVVCVETLVDERTDEVLSTVYDGTIGLKQLLNITSDIGYLDAGSIIEEEVGE